VGLRRVLLLCTGLVAAMIVGLPGSASAACGLDTSFGTGGILTVPDYTLDVGNAVTVDSEGRYLVAGQGLDALAVMRLLPTGAPDPSFGAGTGMVTVRHDDVFSSETLDVTQLSDGRIVAVGRAYWAVSPSSWGDIAVAVLNPDGSRDASFGGGDGVTYIDISQQNEVARSVDVDAQSRIVVGGTTDPGNGASDVVLARLLPDGSLDPTLDTDGIVVRDLGGTYEGAYGIDVLPDGRIVAAGSHQTDVVRPWLARFLTDGGLDTSFGRRGLVLPRANGAWYDAVAGPDGSVFVGGAEELQLVVAKYTSNGRISRSYGSSGRARISLGPWPEPSPFARGLALLGDGSVVAAGAATRTSYSEGVIVRITPAGTVDPSFGIAGVIRYSEDPQYSTSSFSSVAALPGGGTVVAGTGYAGAIVARTC
jgi:uncharacterized delta-60 repeat protein